MTYYFQENSIPMCQYCKKRPCRGKEDNCSGVSMTVISPAGNMLLIKTPEKFSDDTPKPFKKELVQKFMKLEREKDDNHRPKRTNRTSRSS